MEKRLKNKVALITYANSCMGRSIARIFAREGAKVCLHIGNSDLNLDDTDVNNTVREIERSGGEILLLKADFTNPYDVKTTVNTLIKKYAKIDILVNNAGLDLIQSPGTVTEISEDQWESVINDKLKGVLFPLKFSIPFMIKQGEGSVINISSIYSLIGASNLAANCALHGGIALLTKAMATDYAKHNVRINCVCPGFIDTETFRTYVQKQDNPDVLKSSLSDSVPLKRIGNPEEVAYAALFLAGRVSSFVTGITLPVDGGYIVNAVREIL
jgi:NAD(P)-dependent dehydrogenase (short-subunit alcohol dehydrogenase family)